jgi:pimeloyl-ACP methyl ester carboxylesterase
MLSIQAESSVERLAETSGRQPPTDAGLTSQPSAAPALRPARTSEPPRTGYGRAGVNRVELQRDDVTLSLEDFGGVGPPMLLLHGLAGYAGEWELSARFLCKSYRVFALDQRGHGHSDRRPDDVSRSAFVKDCVAAVRHIDLGPVLLVGQSMGANTAMLVAGAHPDLVQGLVMIEGSPDGPEPPLSEPEITRHFTETLSAWPVPFADEQAAAEFFVAKGFDPTSWTHGLEPRSGGLWPRWDVATLARTMGDLGSRTYWTEWRSIQNPTLVILGEHGIYPAGHGEELVAELPGAVAVTIPGAGHDVHLDAPQLWVEALQRSIAN